MGSNKRNQQSQLNQEPKASSTKFVLSSRQSMMIISSTIVGTGILTLPRTATYSAHQSAWIVSIFAGAIAFVLMWFITKLGLRFHGKTFVEYNEELLGTKRVRVIGKILSYVISSMFIAVWLAIAIKSIRVFAEVLVVAVLPETPIEVIIATMLMAMMLFLLVELEVIGRFNEIMFPLIIIPITLIAIVSLQDADWSNIFPIFDLNLASFFNNFTDNFFAYQGFTVMLLFMAFTQRGKNTEAAVGGIAVPAFNYALIIFASVAVFGFQELQQQMWPTLELAKSARFSFFLLERIESAFVAVWVVAVFLTAGNLFYAACFAMAQMFPTRKEDTARKWTALCLLPIMYWLAMLPSDVYKLFNWSKYIGYSSFVLYALIILLYLIAVLRKKGKGRSHHHESQRQ